MAEEQLRKIASATDNTSKALLSDGQVAPVRPLRNGGVIDQLKTLLMIGGVLVSKKVLLDRDEKTLREASELLQRQLYTRHEPIESREIQERAVNLQRQMFGARLAKLDSEQRSAVEPQVKEAIINKLQETTYRWKPICYDEFGSLCYLLGRFPLEFASLQNVFKEMSLLDPLFEPQTCLDFGSGVGSVWWVLHDLYPSSFREYFSVETQKPMRDLARQLAQGGELHGAMPFEQYVQRAKLPSSTGLKYDITVSAFSLMELPNSRERLSVVETLWNKTSRYLVIVENGNRSGFRLLSEARKFVLEMSDRPNEAASYVLAPCTHGLPCQRYLADSASYPCSFPARYKSLGGQTAKQCSYSYVILSKVRPKAEPCARIIESVLRKPRHVICRICTSKGQIVEKIISKRKHAREVYSFARHSHWGDQYPHEEIPSASKGSPQRS